MLGQSQKFALRQSPDFFQKAQKINGTYLRVWYLPQEKMQATVVVGKKVASLAVDRNALKRQVYSFFQQDRLWPAAALVVVLFPRAAQASTQELQQDLSTCIKKIHGFTTAD